MTARPLTYHQRGGYLALFGSPEPRDNYIGEFRPAVVEHRDPELACLNDADRATLQAAVIAMHRQNAEGRSDD